MTSQGSVSRREFCKRCGGILTPSSDPFTSLRQRAIPIMGVFVSTPECQHCIKDKRYLNETPGMQIVHQLRAEFQAGHITHLEFVMSEIEQLRESLSIVDDNVIPEKIREEVIAYLQRLADPPQEQVSQIEINGVLMDFTAFPPEQPRHVGVPVAEYLSNWDPRTETTTVEASWSSVIQLIPENELPPLVAMWRRYVDLKNPKDFFGRVRSYQDAYSWRDDHDDW